MGLDLSGLAPRRTPDGVPADSGARQLNPLATGPVPLSSTDLQRFRGSPRRALSPVRSRGPFRDPGVPDELPRTATVRRALAAPAYTDFSLLVESIHAGIHTWVGGAMSLISVASYDRVFWAHHAMIDGSGTCGSSPHRAGRPPTSWTMPCPRSR